MNKRERIERTLAGEPTDRVPVALWRHWPGDDQRAADLARATVDFQRQWDFDFVKVSPADSYPLHDYGVRDEWNGTIEGIRDYTRRAVNAPEDWEKLATLDPHAGMLGEQLQTLRLLAEPLMDVPFIQTIFSPFAQAKNIAGTETMFRHMHQYPDQFKTGLEIITANTLRYLDALRDTGVAGIYYAIQHASYDDMTEAQYREFGRALDLQILEAIDSTWWFNLLHLHGTSTMFDLISDYPVQAINWHDRETSPSLAQGQERFSGVVSGGLSQWDVHNSTPEAVREQAQDAIQQTGGQRFILATGCVVIATTPQANIRAVREVVGA